MMLTEFLERYPMLCEVSADIADSNKAWINCYQNGGKLLVCGNGGSAADSEHIVGELMKGFRKKRRLNADQTALFSAVPNGERIADCLQNALPAISLVSQTGLMTAYANDVDAQLIFAQQVWGYGKKGDILVALSTSGNSKNIALAAETAKAMGLTVISITGRTRSQLSELSDICIKLPAETPRDVQELTLPVYHYLCEATEAYFFAE